MEEEIILVPDDEYGEAQGGKFVWGQPMVKLLIAEFKKVENEFNHTNIRKKNVWRKIANAFHEQGYTVTEEMCDKKWRNLKKTFKEIYIGQRSSNTMIKWPYYQDVEEIFSKDQNIIAASLTSSLQKNFISSRKVKGEEGHEVRVELMEVVGNLDEEYVHEAEGTSDNEDSHFWTTYETPAHNEPPPWFSEFLQQYRIDEEKKMELISKMHAETMALEEKKCSLLASLIDKLGGLQENVMPSSKSYYLRLDKDETDGEIVSDN